MDVVVIEVGGLPLTLIAIPTLWTYFYVRDRIKERKHSAELRELLDEIRAVRQSASVKQSR